ncbi:hypothetical protein NPIL_682581 [Nephila pilipes]|uniref:Uncharacterized protein n=1 Tax=Nephila pilipes TaxID=299642 RepID=A0A8X6PH42_NEPPI|nr:hypothetical protein NPIL_682581 [Nephila pilipes]
MATARRRKKEWQKRHGCWYQHATAYGLADEEQQQCATAFCLFLRLLRLQLVYWCACLQGIFSWPQKLVLTICVTVHDMYLVSSGDYLSRIIQGRF